VFVHVASEGFWPAVPGLPWGIGGDGDRAIGQRDLVISRHLTRDEGSQLLDHYTAMLIERMGRRDLGQRV
jgi:hypothetical protein